MDIKSIVVIKPAEINPDMAHLIQWQPVRDEKTPYVIRGFDTCPISKGTVVYLEEDVVGYNDVGKEIGVNISFCIEILPPGEVCIEELISEPEMA